MVKIPNLDEMLKAGMHFGHKTSKWHPKMEPFIFGAKNGIHIINLAKSQKMLEEALAYISKLAEEQKIILFVGTKNQVKKPLKEMAKENNMAYVSERWLGGTLTNFPIIRQLIKKYKDLNEKMQAGKLERYTKKERLEFEREIERLEKRVGGMVNMNKIPDAVFIWDIKKEKTALTESLKKNVPIIAICDTNVNPAGIKYVIPSNDDATKAIKLLVGLIGEAVQEGRAKAKKQN